MSSKFVLIDAGHNELIAGKRSPDGSLLEYEFNYDVANKIKKHLERHGIKAEVMQIRTSSATEDVNQRVSKANKLKPDILVSIHANAAGVSGWYIGTDGLSWNTANGWEVFCYEPHKASGESYKLAKAIETESIQLLGLRNRGIKDGKSLGMVARTTMPAVLIEHAFYTNEKECRLLQSQAFREKCALADAKGIVNYFGLEWIGSDYSKAVQERFGFEEQTMRYLENYKYSNDLLRKLATMK